MDDALKKYNVNDALIQFIIICWLSKLVQGSQIWKYSPQNNENK